MYYAGSNEVRGTAWNDNNKRWPLDRLFFRLGTSHPGEAATVNSRYRDVKVFWGRPSMRLFALD